MDFLLKKRALLKRQREERETLHEISDSDILKECKAFTMHLKPLWVPATLEQERDSRLTQFGYLLEEVEGDGNCLLRAISQQLWRSQKYYELLRRIVVAQLNLNRDLYRNVIPSDIEYLEAVRDCKTTDCSVPIVAAYCIADVLEVEFAILCSYSPLTPFFLVKPQDPRTIIRKKLYLCTTMERLGDEIGHCDSMVPMHRTVHEPVSIPPKAVLWMKEHKLLMLEDLKLFPPKARSPTLSIPDLSKGASRGSLHDERSAKGNKRRRYKGVPAESGPSKLGGSSVGNRHFDFKKLLEITSTAKTSNLRHKPIGIGVRSLADTFILLGMAFDSPEAQQLNKDIFETIYYHALKTSSQIAEKEGPYETYIGSPVSKVRISSKPEGQGARGLAWHHATCFLDASRTTQLENLDGWESLTDSNKSAVLSMVKTVSANKKGKDEVKEEKDSLKGSANRKGAVDHDQKLKMAKTEDDNKNNELDPSKLQSLLEAQTKELWALKNHVSTAELREMLEANNQSTPGSEIDLRDRCADGMLFGALESCKLCNGHLHYSGGTYKCRGFLTEWSKCANSTSEPDRVKGKWKIPEETKNQYLKKWFKTQKANKPSRIIPPPLPSTPAKPAGNGTSQSSYSEMLADLMVSIISFSSETMDVWKAKIESVGGQFHPKVKKDTNCLVVCGVPDNMHAEMRKARRMKVPIVREDYLADCFERQKKLRLDIYKIEAGEEANKSMVTVKVKGGSAVHEASGLQDTGHILEHGKSIYNTTLSISDLSTGINSYYILQIIEEDKGSGCYVFRKWGRVSNEKIGGTKLQEFSKTEAIKEFKRLFLEKTGNPWESWEQKKLQKQPGKFYPLDIDYGVNKDAQKTNEIKNAKSQLAPPLAELMKMLFNVETYRAAMMEFEINMAEMPLGKLSKSNIQKGFEVLTELQNLLKGMNDNLALRESMIVDASNRFFTVIPSVHPHVIKDEDDFKLKVKMLEALQDIEIASRLVVFHADNDDSIDDKYKKLQCEMGPLPHDSEDYRLVEKYLQTTHAPTHTDWALELEVFTVDRRGEFDKFSPYKDKLKNKMLLWHGLRWTNLVGILSQGLRIAPPEAPATGYMFGKGIYFADLVSKSAQYCFPDKKNRVGLMLLSEVALGDMYELKNAKYMDKPPKGKDSTKGLGQKIPVKWRDDVVVPCGKPVSSNVKATGLMYIEYIVYNSDQVKLKFLLKVGFSSLEVKKENCRSCNVQKR